MRGLAYIDFAAVTHGLALQERPLAPNVHGVTISSDGAARRYRKRLPETIAA
jgi:hypothetical protein